MTDYGKAAQNHLDEAHKALEKIKKLTALQEEYHQQAEWSIAQSKKLAAEITGLMAHAEGHKTAADAWIKQAKGENI